MKLIVDGVTFQCHPGMIMTLVPDVDGEVILPIGLKVDRGDIMYLGCPLAHLAYNKALSPVCNLGDFTIKMTSPPLVAPTPGHRVLHAAIYPPTPPPPGPGLDEPKKIKWREFL